MADLITANSTPDLDAWGPDSYWGCYEWITYHKALKAKHGLPLANQIFIREWDKQDAWASPYNWCKYNTEFTGYFKAQGLPAGHLLSNLVLDAADTVENVSDTVKRTSSLLKGVLPFAVVALLLLFAYNKSK